VLNIKFGAGAASRYGSGYGSGFTKLMQLRLHNTAHCHVCCTVIYVHLEHSCICLLIRDAEPHHFGGAGTPFYFAVGRSYVDLAFRRSVVRRMVAFGEWSFGEWSPPEIGRLRRLVVRRMVVRRLVVRRIDGVPFLCNRHHKYYNVKNILWQFS
jgi:hypothetical protein